MKLAIMQPYLFPYIGYLQLIAEADRFVLLDDVNYINKGWINRNRILVNGKDHLFTIPLQEASQNKWINQISVQDDPKWKDKFLKLIQMAYAKAPMYKNVLPLVERIIQHPELNLSDYIRNSLEVLCAYLQIKTTLVPSSSIYENRELKGADRILDICLKEKAADYFNPSGGMELYDKETFRKAGVNLHFFRSGKVEYKQFKNEFVPYLSILDVLMFNEVEEVRSFLPAFEIL
jgi:hypothetical protein